MHCPSNWAILELFVAIILGPRRIMGTVNLKQWKARVEYVINSLMHFRMHEAKWSSITHELGPVGYSNRECSTVEHASPGAG